MLFLPLFLSNIFTKTIRTRSDNSVHLQVRVYSIYYSIAYIKEPAYGFVQVKVKLSLYLIKNHAMKRYGKVRVYLYNS
jgi:hypothetical protein